MHICVRSVFLVPSNSDYRKNTLLLNTTPQVPDFATMVSDVFAMFWATFHKRKTCSVTHIYNDGCL